MGFPEWFQIPVSDTQAYRQFGNSVVVPVVTQIAKALVPYLREGADELPEAIPEREGEGQQLRFELV
jgi:DNA (cytosine-5)-methyltransferase 1